MSAKSGSTQTYSEGQIVVGKVDRVLPFGAFVRLKDGTRAYIRRRELSLEGDLDPRTLVSQGEEIRAKVSNLGGPGRSMELSMRATLPDPWKQFTSQFREGDVVIATVKELVPRGGFAQIVPGVKGFIPLHELASWKVERPEEVVWTDDHVEAVITWLDSTRRRVTLSIRRRLSQLSRAEVVMEKLHQRAGPQTTGEVPLEEEQLSISEAEQSDEIEGAGPVLVVEDDNAIREPLVKWLTRRGCVAQGVRTVPEAVVFCQRHDYGLILVDLDLPGLDGLSLIRQLRNCGHSTPVAVMSSPEWIEEHLPEIQALEVAEVFPKPLDLDDIQQLLRRQAKGEKLGVQLEPAASTAAAERQPFQELAAAMRSGQPLAGRFRQGLEQLVEATRAEEGIVFHLDQISQTVSIAAQAGTISLNQDAIYSLIGSPVKDVIEEEGPVWENRISQGRAARFRKLLDLLPFESCIGVPVEASGQAEHALFLFHREPDAFSRYRLRDAWAMATLFAAALESQALDKRIQAMSRILLSGQLAAGFGHEVYNKLSGLELQFRNVRSDFRFLGRDHPAVGASSDFREIEHTLDRAVETAMDLKRAVIDFRRLMETREEQAVDVNQVARQAEALVQPLARRAKVDLRLIVDQNLPPAVGSAIGLQQVFLNLMLNAVQHMERKPDDRRVLEIAIACEVGDGDHPVKVRFSDTGLGIHRQLWEKVFALGFTTRPGGSGLGLYIARSLVESMGGRIFVEESLVPLGTAFLVELPAAGGRGREA